MIATIANCAMVPPKLMPGVSRNGGVYSGSSASAPKTRHAEAPLLHPGQAVPPLPQPVARAAR